MESSSGMSQGTETLSSQPGVTSATPAQSAPVQTPEERVFKQSEVNDIVKRAKHGAVEDYRRLQSEQPQYAQQKYGEAAPHQPQNTPPAVNTHESEIRRLAAEEAQRLRDQWVQDAQTRSQTENAQKIVQDFWNKISPGKEKYQDFDKVTGDIEYAKFPSVVQLLAQYVDNSHDVLYELGKNRINLSQLELLAERSPKDAIVHAQRLSQSLKDNEAAGKMRLPNEPLSQMRPSSSGTDNGVLGFKDLKKKYKG